MPLYDFYIDKRSGTSADTLLAVGFAEILDTLSGQDVEIHDRGSHYQLRSRFDPTTIVDNIEHLNLIQPISTDKQPIVDGFSYEQQKAQRDIYRKLLNELPPKLRNTDAILNQAPDLVAIADQKPSSLLPLYLIINQMKVAISFNPPIINWRNLSIQQKNTILELLIRLFRITPNPYQAIVKEWQIFAKQHKLDQTMTMLQVTNPTAGKGANRPKSNRLDIGNMEEWWVLEWIKFLGFFDLAHPQVIRDSKDRKTYIIKPKAIYFRELRKIVDAFREVAWSNSPVKMDVQNILRLLQVLVKNQRNALSNTQTHSKRKYKPPSDLIEGCEVTFYKDMGSAFAVMNIAALNIPEWIPAIETLAQAHQIDLVLKEHLAVVQTIRAYDGGERSEEYSLLACYRDFLSSRTVEPLLDFCALYAPYLGQKIERGEKTQRFSVPTLTEVFSMQKPLNSIISSIGFQKIADAIRNCTVTLQYKKAKGERVAFEIRYGLTQELIRRSNHTDDFIASLTDFIAKYNTESAQKFETSKGVDKRSRVTQTDLDDIIALLDVGYKSSVIARMLVAYGSARKERKINEAGSISEEV
ncbi:hypothetical protein [Herpetosiphon llansteffanensis]|uniref:hypothetical protein n=1 Tax=Herpetosiphon llansteffanensis TaxID=2094568 RepID=UPI000D7CD203|nr:hypothetical protein [Herpetosiphon llansteffanensis]